MPSFHIINQYANFLPKLITQEMSFIHITIIALLNQVETKQTL